MNKFGATLAMLMLIAGGLTSCGVDNNRTIDRDVERNVKIDRDKDGRMDSMNADRDNDGRLDRVDRD
ncbi:MAG: hypothetical protein K2W95_16950 [Candidatus Obscuribacterales bacterium]|nr:hypothetical protein [Candidatus Obscuribacterales bacterium]